MLTRIVYVALKAEELLINRVKDCERLSPYESKSKSKTRRETHRHTHKAQAPPALTNDPDELSQALKLSKSKDVASLKPHYKVEAEDEDQAFREAT